MVQKSEQPLSPNTERLNPYLIPDANRCVPDVWEQEDDREVSVDVLLPTGYFLTCKVDRNVTLAQLKEVVWESAQKLPLHDLLEDFESYVFQCVNLCTARRDELSDEERRLSEVRPFQAVLKLDKRKEHPDDRVLDSRLGFVIGKKISELDDQKDPEVSDFRRQMKVFCESIYASKEQDTWESRVLRQYPVSVESSPDLPQYLQSKLYDGHIVLTISVGQSNSESTFKFSVLHSIKSNKLLELVLEKKGPSLGLQKNHKQDLILKICGLEEYLIGPYYLSQYKYIRECLSCDKVPELVLLSADFVQLEADNYRLEDRQRSRSLNSEGFSTLKRKKTSSISSWIISDHFSITIHSLHNLTYENQSKISVQCSLYHADEILCKVFYSTEKALETGEATWEETITFDLEVHNIPRVAKLCICVFETSPTQKNSRFRKCQDKYACPIAWVNTTVFDYNGYLKSAPLKLFMWPYSQEGDEYSSVMLRPLGLLSCNPNKEQASALVVSFAKYDPTAQVSFPSLEEVLDFADKPAVDGSDTTSGTPPQASKAYFQQLQQICERDSLYQLHEQEKQLMWFLREKCCEQLPSSLPKLLRCLKWNDRADVAQITKLLHVWPTIAPYRALELLDYAYPDPMVRSFAVSNLRSISDEELALYMLQLVQALKHSPYLQNGLVKFLLERALENRHNGHRLFWLLRSEIHFPEVSMRFGLILEAYCRSVPCHLDALEKQVEALEKFKSTNNTIKNKISVKKESKEKLKELIQQLLGKNLCEALIKGLLNPLDPRFKLGKIKVEKCKCLDSKMKPLWLTFQNTDTYGKDVFLIFKNGDDLRQDMLTLQMIRIMDRLWKEEGLDLRMIPYQCMATGHLEGLIEVVPDADTIANIQKEKGFTPTSAFKKGSILSWLKDHNPDEASLNRATEEFTLSCAGYCVATYVLGVADRHSDNIMVKTNGQLFHVDFGHILGKFKEKFGFKRERVPFVLTHDFVYIITKGQTQRSQEFLRFQQHCERAFMILRRKGPLVISLFAMMLSTGIPELSSEKDLDYLRETLVLDRSEREALHHFQAKFDEAFKNSWKTSINWAAHNLAKDNKLTDN